MDQVLRPLIRPLKYHPCTSAGIKLPDVGFEEVAREKKLSQAFLSGDHFITTENGGTCMVWCMPAPGHVICNCMF